MYVKCFLGLFLAHQFTTSSNGTDGYYDDDVDDVDGGDDDDDVDDVDDDDDDDNDSDDNSDDDDDDDNVYLHKLQTRVSKNLYHIFPYRPTRKA
jgi:hypothetical protein